MKSARRWVPALEWGRRYRRADVPGDLLAGTIVAIMLVPQAMAYAMLAGLPPEVGLYASIAPAALYAVFGTSRSLAVGPVALVSLLVAHGLEPWAGDPAQMLEHALILAALVGAIHLLMAGLRAGVLVNYLSQPVLSGFTSAAAILIGVSQLQHVLGVSIPRGGHVVAAVLALVRALPETNPVALSVGAAAIGVLWAFRHRVEGWLRAMGMPAAWIVPVSRSGPLLVVIAATLVTGTLRLATRADLAVVGGIPRGVPGLTLPAFDLGTWATLLPSALLIACVSFLQSVSVARSLASRTGERTDPNQELIALGLANLAGGLSGGYPVAGSFSRSVVSVTAGANTALASVVSAAFVAVAAVLFTPWFHHLPVAVLAAIILVALSSLIDLQTPRQVWRCSRGDAVSWAVTFAGVLALGVARGILIGAATAVGVFVWRTSRPHAAILGLVPGSEHFRNVLRHPVQTCPYVTFLRIDASLYFANSRYLEDHTLRVAARERRLRALVLVMSAVNFIDSTALAALGRVQEQLHEAGIRLVLAEVKGPVMDRIERSGFVDRIGRDSVYLSPYEAWVALGCDSSLPDTPTRAAEVTLGDPVRTHF